MAVKQAARQRKAGGAPASDVERERRGEAVVLTLARPDSRNCLSESMIAALHGGIAAAARDARVRAVVIAAKGTAFCAGHDLKELTSRRSDADGGRAYYAEIMRRCSAMMQAIVRCPKPVIAAVQGTATAAGCQLVATCDLAVAAETARFATPGVNIGLFCSTPMVALSRAVGRKAAMEMLLTGELIDADTACRLGLVNRVVPQHGLRREVDDLARHIAGKSALVLKIGKEAFYRQAELDLQGAYKYAAEIMTTNMLARDAAEGIDAFLGKRAPQWQDR